MKDTIYREDALDATRKLSSIIGGSYISKGDMQSILMQLPSAKPEKGLLHWACHNCDNVGSDICSECCRAYPDEFQRK